MGTKDSSGATIRVGTWIIIKALWYEATSDDPNHRHYELTTREVCVKVNNLITEMNLQFDRSQSRLGTGVLGDAAHVAICRHNFSNVISEF